MAAMAMGVGYLIAAGGPRWSAPCSTSTAAWTWPILVLLAMTVAQWPAALRAVRNE